MSNAFDDFPFDPAMLAYALADANAWGWGDSRAAAIVPQRSAVGFVRGDSSREAELVEALLDARIFQTRPRVTFSVPDAAWCDALLAAARLNSRIIPRIDFEYLAEPVARRDLPARIELAPLDESLLDRACECEPDFDPTYFAAMNGFGWCAIERGKVVSISWAPAIAGWAEIGVATAASHRNRGLARAVGLATLDEALLRNLTPHVSTNESNLAAKAWARSIVFGNQKAHEWVVLSPK